MQNQQILNDFNTLCNGDLEAFKLRFSKSFPEYSYFLYQKNNEKSGDIWKIKFDDLNTEEKRLVYKQGLIELISKSEKLNYSDIWEYLNLLAKAAKFN